MKATYLHISVANQTLTYWLEGKCEARYSISTSKKGVGELENSEQTPRGWHYIRAKIGEGMPENTVFVGRRPTGESYSDSLCINYPTRDWILTRILWLCGLEKGKNRGGNVDTMRRYIYIHGTSDEHFIGQPISRGCIRMKNKDIVSLFQVVDLFTKVLIEE